MMNRLQNWLDAFAPDAKLDAEFEAMMPEGIVTLTDMKSVIRQKRPALFIRNNKPVFEQSDWSQTWTERIRIAPGLVSAAKAVGRIETGRDAHVGTGWLIDEGILVTNRHVAMEVLHAGESRFVTDFLHEHESSKERAFQLGEVVHIEPHGGLDFAFFKVAKPRNNEHELASRIELAPKPTTGRVAVIGYPGDDPRSPDRQLVHEVFGHVYDVKRLAPGIVKEVVDGNLYHDASTLGGNSGSVVLDLDTGNAIGLHCSGRQAELRNVAVSGEVLMHARDNSSNWIPKVTYSSKTHSFPRANDAQSASAAMASRAVAVVDDDSLVEGSLEEATVDSYQSRKGYDPAFLGADIPVALPTVSQLDDVLTYEAEGETKAELPYHHFSVVMSRSRRMCIYSAVNIDGKSSRGTSRKGWRFDPRIPKSAQIMKECYGSAPKFSRGHMTRREDPAWGETPAIRQAASTDTMHVTNATPQMQAFNSPIWLELENYALSHAREDDMKISVMTGPYFNYNDLEDPVLWGVTIPRVFWKIIAFRHEDTGRLCATGYQISQEGNIPTDPEAEYVYGDFFSSHLNVSVQVPIAAIEVNAGLDFGSLRDADPLSSEESVSSIRSPLMAPSQVRFR